MVPRDTTTGRVLEESILPALHRGGYETTRQFVIGKKPNGRRHKVDTIAVKDGKSILVSQKWQQKGGTAEEKVAFEVLCLAEAVRKSEGRYEKAILVLGGIDAKPGERARAGKPGRKGQPGWTLRQWFIGGGLDEHLGHRDVVDIMDLETFIVRANDGAL